jgi:hypothetical protein
VCSLPIQHNADTLLATLAKERISKEAKDHPIIWIAHSLGGILVKRALEISSDPPAQMVGLRSIYTSTYGVMFLGKPHNAADPAKWRLMLQAISSAAMPRDFLEFERQLLKMLPINDRTLLDINFNFLNIYPNRLKVCMALERIGTDLEGTRSLIVDEVVAGPRLPDVDYFEIEATHLALCKFESENSPGYSNISHTLKSWVQEGGC